MTVTLKQLWNKVNRLDCGMCGAEHPVGKGNVLNWEFNNDQDVESAYEFVNCCPDPALMAKVVTTEPLGIDGEDDFKIRENPGLGIYEDIWEYDVQAIEEDGDLE